MPVPCPLGLSTRTEAGLGPFLEFFAERSATGICVLRGPGLEVVYANPAQRRLIGLPSDADLAGRTLFELTGQASFPRLAGVMRTGEPSEVRGAAYRREDGHTTHWDATVEPLLGPDGQVDGLLLFVLDAGPRVAALAEARARAAELETLVDHMTEGVWVFTGGRCVRVNRAGTRLVGDAAEQMLGRSLGELAAHYCLTRLDGMPLVDADLAVTRTEANLRARLLRPDRSTAVLAVSAAPVPGGASSDSVICVVRDVTPQGQSPAPQGALEPGRRHTERWKAIVQHVPVGVRIWDSSGVLREQNRRAAEIMGALPGDLRTEAGRILAVGGRPTTMQGTPTARALAGETVVRQDVVMMTPDGAERHLVTSAQPLRSADGKLDEVLTVFSDVTEHRRLERVRDEFLAILAHELRNPLAAMQASAEAAQGWLVREEAGGTSARAGGEAVPKAVGTPLGPPQQDGGGSGAGDLLRGHGAERRINLARVRRHLARAIGQAERMNELLSELLDAARLGIARPILHPHVVDVATICREAAENAAATRARPCVFVGRNVALPVRADPQRLTQILANLLNNACKYSPPDARVEVAVERHVGEAVVQVCDRGIGVPPGEERRIFEGFYRAHNVRGPGGPPGLGIGLHVAHTLVAEHGGRIGVRPNPGGGSIFYFTLPLKEAPD